MSEARERWMALLRSEIDRRQADTLGGTSDDPREQLQRELAQMTERLAATAHRHPLDTSDMSPLELLAARLLPKGIRPVGLPTEAAVWAQFRARSKDR